MDEEIEVVAFACRGTLVDWKGAIDAVAYELARRNGESPLDRGAALGRCVETLADGDGLARGFERLADGRGYRGEESGDESLARVVAMARPLRDARTAVALAVRSAGAALEAIMYVSTAEWRRVEARRRGMRAVAPHKLGPALATHTPPPTILVV
jgi:hypothetical protein